MNDKEFRGSLLFAASQLWKLYSDVTSVKDLKTLIEVRLKVDEVLSILEDIDDLLEVT